jgi:hypothetical protein
MKLNRFEGLFMLSRTTMGLASGIVVAAGVGLFAFRSWKAHSVPRAGRLWVDGFSADFVDQNLHSPKDSCTGRVYVNALHSPRGIRTEEKCGDRERVSVSPAGNLPYVVLDPVARTYWKPKVSSRVTVRSSRPGEPMEPLAGGESAVRRYVGREQLNGREAEHWEISEAQANGESLVWQYWEDPRLHAALKQDRPGIQLYELRNVREGGQPAALFQIPDGYREVLVPE